VLFSRRKISTGRDWLISSLCVCFALWPLAIKLDESIQLTQQRDAREELIARAKAAGGTEVVLPPFFIRGVGYDKTRVRRWNMVEIGDINVDWSNKCFADTYELSKSSRADIPK
jgi:hypothetical protein